MNLNPNSPLSSPVSLDNLVTSLCLCFLIYKMGENIAPISRGAVVIKSHNIPVGHLECAWHIVPNHPTAAALRLEMRADQFTGACPGVLN